MRERYRIADLETCLWNESGAPGSEKSIESFTRITNVTAANESTRNVRTPNCSSACFLHDSIDIDIDAKPAQSFDNVFRAFFASIAKSCEPLLEVIGLRDVKSE
jgi:hypothetical protein